MTDFMREHGRIAGIFAAAAFVLSLFIGLVSRNPFPVALLRAILLALLFAGLGAGVKAAVRKWLPEIAEGAERVPAPAHRSVDIVLPGEAYDSTGAGGPTEELKGADEPVGEPELGGEPELAGELEPVRERELAGEPEELSGDPGMTGEESSAGEIASLEEAEPADAAESAARTGADAYEEPGGEGSVEGVEELPTQAFTRAGSEALPDLGELGKPGSHGTPSSVPLGAEPSPPRVSRPARRALTPDDAMKGSLGAEDPESLAKAIRTVLKRDEKG